MGAPHTLQKRAWGVRSSCPHDKRRRVSGRTEVGASGVVSNSRGSSIPVGSTDAEGIVSNGSLSYLSFTVASEPVPILKLAK